MEKLMPGGWSLKKTQLASCYAMSGTVLPFGYAISRTALALIWYSGRYVDMDRYFVAVVVDIAEKEQFAFR
eukprot:3920844-Rhodomonas_salina.1